MNPAQLIPTPDTLPVTWPWFKALLIPCFMVHLLFMNALLGTAVLGWVHVLGSRGRETAGAISRKLPFYAAFTINFGVAALLFMQVLYGHLFYTSSILMAVWWLSALALLAAAYGAAYWIEFRFERLAGGLALVWTAMAVSLLLVAFVFTNNMTLMLDPEAWPRYFQNPRGTLWHWQDPTLWPRYLHFVTASVAVGGLVLAVINRKRPAEYTDGFMQWFTVATALQLVIGGWLFMTLPADIRLAFLGGNAQATAFFAMALAGFLVSMVFGSRRRIWPSVGALLFTVAAMVLVRDALRDLYLAPYFTPDKLTVHAQYSPLVVFGLFVAVGAAAVWYLVRLYNGSSNRQMVE